MRLRTFWVVAGVGFVLAACGGGNLTLSEYAAEGESLVTAVRERVAALDAELESQALTVDSARDYWDRRLQARVEFLESFQALEPPEVAAELHTEAVALFSRLNAAEEALAARVAAFETVTEPAQWWDTPEGKAARTADEELFAICEVVQEEFDATQDRESLEDVPWIPPEMKEAVRVFLGCPS